ncbi:GD23544 [Drosophila simulans]|uniref:GD23544 n=1 Tax=Drosophila simulans TaxID=7240 RepID=B4Q6U5_DROSI|nr:GD23544 [Drosophila simulans]
MSKHKTRAILAESIKLIQRQNRELQTNYLQVEKNEKRLKKLLRKLNKHKKHSLFLKKMLSNLKMQINDHDCSQATKLNIGEMLRSQLKVMKNRSIGNIKEAQEYINVVRSLWESHLRYMRRSRSWRRKPKYTFNKSIWMFLNSLKSQTNVKTTKDTDDNKNVSHSKGPYTVTNKFKLFASGDDFNVKSSKKHIHRRIVRPKQLNPINLDFLKDPYEDSQKRSTHNLPASRLKVKVYPRKKIETHNTADEEISPDTDLKQPKIAFGEKILNKEEKQEGTWRRPHYIDSKIIIGRDLKRSKKRKASELKKKFALKNTFPNLKMRLGRLRGVRKNNAAVEDESLEKDTFANLKQRLGKMRHRRVRKNSSAIEDVSLEKDTFPTMKMRLGKHRKLRKDYAAIEDEKEKSTLPNLEAPHGKHRRVRKNNAAIEDESLQKDTFLNLEKPHGKHRSHRTVRKNHTEEENGSLQNVQSEEREESQAKNDLDRSSKSSTIKKIQHFSTYEKLKSAYRTESLKPTRHSSVFNKKDKSEESLAKQKSVSKYIDIKTNLNSSHLSQTSFFSVGKLKVNSGLLPKSSMRSLDDSQPPLSSMATTIINLLFEDRPIASDKPRTHHKTLDITKMSLNTFLGTISRMKPSDQANAVWNDLQGKYREWFSHVIMPEDAQKCKKILKWRYIHNMQKVLHNHVKQFKIDYDGGRSETGSRKSIMSSRAFRSSYVVPTSIGSLGVPKKASSTDISPIRRMHDTLLRLQMDTLRSRAFDKNVEEMERMIMGRQVPMSAEEMEIYKKYKSDPQHYNILILTSGKPITDEKEKRVQEMKFRNEIQKAEEEVMSKVSAESCHMDRTDLNEAYLEARRKIWAAYIAKQDKTPTEILLAQVRYKKRMDQLARKRENREQRILQEQRLHKKRRPLSDLFRAPRRTNRERQAIEDIKDKLEGTKSKCSLTSFCCRQCSRCGLIWSEKCSEESNDTSEEHICQNVKAR